MNFPKLLAGVAVAFALQSALAATTPALQYPQTKKVDQVDDYHGTKVADPYRWLETDVRTSKDVADWVEAENKVTFGYLEQIPFREAIKNRLTQVWNFERYGIPFKKGGNYYFSKNNGLQNQSVIYTMKSLSDAPHVLLDPNTWSQDGTIALQGIWPSDDGKYLVYSAAEAGSDWQTWHVVDLSTEKVMPSEDLKWMKFSNCAWTKDGKGFFYSRFPQPETGKAFQSLNTHQKVYYHRLGSPQADDVLV